MGRTAQGSKSRGHVLSITVLVGVLTLAIGSVTAVSLYVKRLSSTVTHLAQAEPLADYEGRPEKPVFDGVSPVDYLVWVTDSEGGLLAAQLIHLSASRDQLSILGLPSDLAPQASGSLAELHATRPQLAAESVETMLRVRVDHVVWVDLSKVGPVVDALAVDDQAALLRLKQTEAPTTEDISMVVQAVLWRLGVPQAVTNPAQFDRVLTAIEGCIQIDQTVDSGQIEGILTEATVRADEVRFLTLPTLEMAGSRIAEPEAIGVLRAALTADELDQVSGSAFGRR